MKLTRYASLLASTCAAFAAVGSVLYVIGYRTLYFACTSLATACVLVALVIAMRTQRRLIFEQAQSVARMRTLEKQLEAMIQQEASKHDNYSN